MPYTHARIRRDGVALHRHPLGGRYETWYYDRGRGWHEPSVYHHQDPEAHDRNNASVPSWAGGVWVYHRDEVYARALALAVQVPQTRTRRLVQRPSGIWEWEWQPIDERKFGVEIEANLNPGRLHTAFRRRGLELVTEDYNHYTRSYWKLTTDGSLSGFPRRPGYKEGEVVSPPLIGDEGMRQLFLACEALVETDARINRTCGLHVHHDAGDLQWSHVKQIVINYTHAQEAINNLVAPSRRAYGTTYARQMNEHVKSIISDSAGITNALNNMYNNFGGSARYYNLNIQAYERHRTLEFRQHQGTIEYKKIAGWVMLGKKLVEKSSDGLEVPPHIHLPDFLSTIDVNDPLYEYLIRRAGDLALRS